MIIIKIYDSETDHVTDDDMVFSVELDNDEFVQSELSDDANIEEIAEAINIAAEAFADTVSDEFNYPRLQ